MGKGSTKAQLSAEDEEKYIAEILEEDKNRGQSLVTERAAAKEARHAAKRKEIEVAVREKYLYGEQAEIESKLATNREAYEQHSEKQRQVSVPEILKQGGATRIGTTERNTLTSKFGYQIVYKKQAHGAYWKMLDATKKDLTETIGVTILDLKTMPPKKKANFEKQAFKIIRFLAANVQTSIVKYFEMFIIDTELHLFHEKVYYTMENVMKRGPVLSEERAKAWGRDLGEAVHFLHSHGIAHRALSPNAIWLTLDLKLKLGSFGFSCIFWDHKTNARITVDRIHDSEMPFQPPEESAEGPLDPVKQDVYCWAATVVYMLTKEFPPKEEGSFEGFASSKLSAVSVDGHQLLASCLDLEPQKRPFVHNLLHHLWFKSFALAPKEQAQ
ncbi:Serine/threonine-protein kinase kin-29 [Halotydeus destructor]|nr:Serine/threonine-protein kinase kin-29 [Halotydeus destructor]